MRRRPPSVWPPILLLAVVVLASCAPPRSPAPGTEPAGGRPLAWASDPGTSPGPEFAAARPVARAGECLPGICAVCAAGDILLANDRVAVVIAGAGRAGADGELTGCMVDAAPWGGEDRLAHVRLDLGRRPGGEVRYGPPAVTAPGDTAALASHRAGKRLTATGGAAAGEAEVAAEGGCGACPGLRVRTTYALAPRAFSVRVATTLTNAGSDSVHDLDPGDDTAWGRMRAYLPERGRPAAGERFDAAWWAVTSEKVSYGWTAAEGRVSGRLGLNQCLTAAGRVSLAPGESFTWTRFFLLGSGDVASVATEAFRRRGLAVGRLSGRVAEKETRRRVTGGTLRVTAAGGAAGPLLEGTLDRDGRYLVVLPAGDYAATALAPGRAPSPAAPVQVHRGGFAEQDFLLSPQRSLWFRVLDRKSGRRVPARLTVTALAPTPQPELAGDEDLFLCGSALYAPRGQGRLLLAPGRYHVCVSHGLEYDVTCLEVTVPPNRDAWFFARLRHAFDTASALGADLGTGPRRALDCALSPRDWSALFLGEGMDLVTVPDEQSARDLDQAVRAIDVRDTLRTFRASDLAGAGLEEILNGDRPREPWTALVAWAGSLNQGRRSTAAGNPGGDFPLAPGPGRPRTYLLTAPGRAENLRASELAAALGAHRALVTNGPYLTLRAWCERAGGAPSSLTEVGGSLRAVPPDSLELEIQVSAANWVEVRRVHLLENGDPIRSFELAPAQVADSAQAGGPRFWTLVTLRPVRDSWYLAVAEGDRFLLPPEEQPVGDPLPRPFAFTNPIWVDADGDGRWSPPGGAAREPR